MLPASTAAMTIIFFPVFSAIKGFGFRPGVCGDDCTGRSQGKSFWKRVGDLRGVDVIDCSAGGRDTACAGAGGLLEGASVACGRRWRGGGRGVSGRIWNRSVSSWMVGIGVVRALMVMSMLKVNETRMGSTYFTTTI